MRAFFERRIADLLHGLQLMAAALALILVKRHGFPLEGIRAANYSELKLPTQRRLTLVQAFLFEYQRVTLDLGNHAVTRDEVTLEDALRQRIFDLRLDGALHGAGARHRVEARLTDLVARIIIKPK